MKLQLALSLSLVAVAAQAALTVIPYPQHVTEKDGVFVLAPCTVRTFAFE